MSSGFYLKAGPCRSKSPRYSVSRRYRHSSKFIKTNFSLGDDHQPRLMSTYRQDFLPDANVYAASFGIPSLQGSAAASAASNRCLPNVPTSAASHGRPTMCQISADLDSAPVARAEDSLPALSHLDKRIMLQKTNFTFGNDAPDHVTAYMELASSPLSDVRRRPATPPALAQIFPQAVDEGPTGRSTLRNDFTFFGPTINQSLYDTRLGDLEYVKTVNACDSVAHSLLGKRRKMLTRSMVDYQRPVDRVRGNIERLMLSRISPSVRQDSIWSSVNGGGKHNLSSEGRTNFTWPMPDKGMTRFYRGHVNKVR